MRASMLVVSVCSLVVAGFLPPNSARADEPAKREQDQLVTAEVAIREKLVKLDSFAYEDMPLQEIVNDLKMKWDIPIVIDVKALSEASVTADQPISIQLPKVTRKSGLKLILEPIELTYVVRDEVLVVTTQEEAKRALFTCFYDVRDLITAVEEDELRARKLFGETAPAAAAETKPAAKEAPKTDPAGGADVKPQHLDLAASQSAITKFDPMGPYKFRASDVILTLFQETIEPDSWEEAGGPGRMSMLAGVMVVSNTNEVHEHVEVMLAELRKILRSKPAAPNAGTR